jgi:hypothetical protein
MHCKAVVDRQENVNRNGEFVLIPSDGTGPVSNAVESCSLSSVLYLVEERMCDCSKLLDYGFVINVKADA